jgi:hypothetical protein
VHVTVSDELVDAWHVAAGHQHASAAANRALRLLKNRGAKSVRQLIVRENGGERPCLERGARLRERSRLLDRIDIFKHASQASTDRGIVFDEEEPWSRRGSVGYEGGFASRIGARLSRTPSWKSVVVAANVRIDHDKPRFASAVVVRKRRAMIDTSVRHVQELARERRCGDHLAKQSSDCRAARAGLMSGLEHPPVQRDPGSISRRSVREPAARAAERRASFGTKGSGHALNRGG